MRKFIWIFLLAGWGVSPAQSPQISPTQSRQLRVLVFLSPECPLCQSYTLTLNQLDQRYAGKVAFYGVIPGKTWKQSDITAFARKYHILFPLQMDRDLQIAHSLGATVTPEAILITSDSTVLYKGAIDNWYKALGRASNKPTEQYLQEAIDHVLRHEPPPVRSTDPIGCLINDF